MSDMGQTNAHQNRPPTEKDALQYITYSAKELLYLLNEKVDDLDKKIDAMAIEQAKLDARYVTQVEFKDSLHDAVVAKRFALTATLASVGALGTFIGLLVSSL